MNSSFWQTIFEEYKIEKHNFNKMPFEITAQMIKEATAHFKKTNEKEVRILCKQDGREDRPEVFVKNNLFILPTKNGIYNIVKGEGYVDIPMIEKSAKIYNSKLEIVFISFVLVYG